MKCRAAVVALLSVIFTDSNAVARPYGSISVGNWKGGAYTNDQTGSFSHCGAGARYDSGVYFVVMSGGGWSLGFMHENGSSRRARRFRRL